MESDKKQSERIMGISQPFPDRAFQAHLHEYDAVREEITTNFSQQDRLANYALVLTVGASSLFIVGDPPIAREQPFALLVASLLLTAIGWALLETSLTIQLKSRYIIENLAPRLQRLVGPFDDPEFRIFQWSESVVTTSFRSIYHGLIASGKYIICFLPSLVFIFMFRENQTGSFRDWYLSVQVLYVSAIVVLAIVPIGLVLKALAAFKIYPRKV